MACTGCIRKYPQISGVTRFVKAENYADSFGFQWQCYARTELGDATSDQSDRDFRRQTGLTAEDLNGEIVLEVGCGMGRFADVATRVEA